MPQPAARPRRSHPAPSASSALGAPPRTWEEAVDRFLTSKRRHNRASGTLANYRQSLLSTRIQAMRADYEVTVPTDLTAAKLESFLGDLADIGLAPGYVNTIHRHLTTFLRWCRDQSWGHAIDRAVLDVEPMDDPEGIIEVFTPAQELRIMELCTDPRQRFLLRFLLRTGLRASEVCALTLDDIIELPGGLAIRVRRGKGRKPRIVPLDTSTTRFSREVQRYLNRDRPTTAHDALFVSIAKDPRAGDHVPLTVGGLKSMMRRLTDRSASSGQPVHVHAHKFRHTFATRAIAAGANPAVVRDILGHSTLRMVMRYVHLSSGDLVDAVARLSF